MRAISDNGARHQNPVRSALVRRHQGQRVGCRLACLTGLCAAAILISPMLRMALAQDDHKEARAVHAKLVESAPDYMPAPQARPTSKLAGRYFVDFRARTAASYGHAFLWYGRLNARGKVGAIEVAGLHPASDSVVPYILGHIMPVPSETGKSYGDLDEQYLTANYRVYLKEADAKQAFAYIKHKQDSSPLWMASLYNCTAFLTDIASYMGLRTPPAATWMYPEDFINSLRDLNDDRQEITLATSH